MNSVAVLMSTYNGEKYLREQIDSILVQEGVSVSLFVRDDGSSDGTERILKEYAEKDARVRYEMCENVGVGNSFMNLLYSVPDTFDYYAFSDQDDIWLPEKLSEGISLLQKSGVNLYVSNMECVDKDNNSMGIRFSEKDISLSPNTLLLYNNLCGCTMVFTNRFYRMICEETHRPDPDTLQWKNHDGWIAPIAALSRDIVYDERAFIRYRQHENNVVGANGGRKRRLKNWRKKLSDKKCRSVIWRLSNDISRKFPSLAQDNELIQLCRNAKTFKGKMRLLKNQKKVRSYSDEGFFHFCTKVMLGWL